jgi:hypothetical protein
MNYRKRGLWMTGGSIALALMVIAVYALSANARSSAANQLQATPTYPYLDLRHLPLGDGKISTSPQQGYVWSCQTQFGGGGAFRDGDWIKGDGTWDKTAKINVNGSVAWPNAQFTIQIVGTERKITGNDLPNHTTGVFPVQSSDPAYQYDRNPNTITAQKIAFSLPLEPTLAAVPSCVPMGMIGVLNTGAALFNALDGEGRDAAAHEIQDSCDGHPERSGSYHYHSLTACLKDDTNTNSHSELLGYALDGFGVYGFRGENGKILTNADLDECHGHTHEIVWDGKTVVMYHYHATREYPYTVGCFKGTPVQAQLPGGNPGQGQPGGNQRPPPGGTPGQPPPGGPPAGKPPPGGQPPPPGGQPPPPKP